MQRFKKSSIQLYIFTYCLCILLLVGAGLLFTITDKVIHETQEVFDASLVQSTMLVKTILPEALEFDEDDLPRSLLFESETEFSAAILGQTATERQEKSYYENNMVIFLQSASGQPLQSSAQSLSLPVTVKEGFSQQLINGKYWKVFSILDTHHNIWISSAHQQETRQELSRELGIAILPPFLLGTLLICLGIYFSVRQGFKPLIRISAQLNQRHSDNLTAIEETQLPSELDAVILALNRLFAKVELALQREQSFTDDAAHQLRTPLACMLVNLDSLPKEDATSIALHRSVSTMERLVSQLLELARLSPKSRQNLSFSTVDIAVLSAEIIAQLHPLARTHNIAIELLNSTSSCINANPLLIEILITNLIENAIRYSYPQDCIQVSISAIKSEIMISVIDHGPGLDDQEKRNVWSRFYRANEHVSQGSGLGLSIVKEICLLHLADYTLQDTAEGGLTVVITFPVSTN